MRPARVPSSWVKIRPWYYTGRTQPSRAVDGAAAIAADLDANSSLPAEQDFIHKECVGANQSCDLCEMGRANLIAL